MEGRAVGHNFERGLREEDLNVKVYDGCQKMAKVNMAFIHVI